MKCYAKLSLEVIFPHVQRIRRILALFAEEESWFTHNRREDDKTKKRRSDGDMSETRVPPDCNGSHYVCVVRIAVVHVAITGD